MVARELYLSKLRPFKNKEVIKVITGLRRSGKSTFLMQVKEELLKEGIKEKQIIYINFEDLNNEYLLEYHKLHEYILNKLDKDNFNYIFLDEIQRVKDFQKAVDSLYIMKNVDIYITGSNSDLLSSELSSLLTGRYVEINLLPLSFKEFVSFNKESDKRDLFRKYLENGGLPYTLSLPNEESIDIYLSGIFNTIINNDILMRHPHIELGILESILRFLVHNVGSLVSSTKIANTLTSNGRKTSYNTVELYISYLKESFLVYEAKRFDIKGKQHLKSLSKYYIVDLGFRKMLLANASKDLGHTLENVVYFELLRRGYDVRVGKWNGNEVDFVAIKGGKIEYFQVTASIMDTSKRKQELEVLEKINDSYSKTLITLDDFGLGNYNGIEIVNIIDFLLL